MNSERFCPLNNDVVVLGNFIDRTGRLHLPASFRPYFDLYGSLGILPSVSRLMHTHAVRTCECGFT